MHKLVKSRKYLARLMSVFAVLIVVVFSIGLGRGIITLADTTGGSGTTSGGSGSAGSSVTKGNFISDSTAGYRIYFARNTLTVYSDAATFDSDVYTRLGEFRDIAIHEFYTWNGTTGYTDNDIYNYFNGSYLNKAVYLEKSPTNSCDFSELGLSGSIARVAYNKPLDYTSFVNFANQLNSIKVSTFKDRYISYLQSIGSSLSDSQKELVNTLDSIRAESLNIIVEPVFVSGRNGGGSAYTIGWQDWGNGLSAKDTGYKLSNRCDKLVNFKTEFTYNSKDYDPSSYSGVYGFGTYKTGINSPKESIVTSLGVSYNITHTESNKDSVSIPLSSSGISSLSCVTTQYSHVSSDSLVANLGSSSYSNAFNGISNMATSANSSATLAGTNLVMAGESYKSTVMSNVGLAGADYSSYSYLKACLKRADMRENMGTPSNYMLGVYGNFSYPQVTAIDGNEQYVASVKSCSIPVVSGSRITTASFYNGTLTSPVGNAGLSSAYMWRDIRYLDTLVTSPTAKTVGYIYTPTLAHPGGTVLDDSGINGDLSVFARATQGCIPLQVSGSSKQTFTAEYENGEPKYQGTGAEVKELLNRIEGSSLGASKVNVEINEDTPLNMTVLPSSNVRLTVTTLVNKIYSNNYVASARIGKGDNVDSTGVLSYKFMSTGNSFANKHVIETTTDFDVNSKNFSTVGETGQDGSTYAILWKTSNLSDLIKSNEALSSYDLTYDDRASRAGNIAGALANYLSTDGSAKRYISKETVNNSVLNIDNYVGGDYYQRLASGFSKITGLAGTDVQVIKLGRGTDINVPMSIGATKSSGYSVLLLTVDEFDIPVIGEDSLPSNMINAVVPSLLGTSNKKGSASSVSNDLSALCTFKPQGVESYSISESREGDVTTFSGDDGLFYNQQAGIFDEANITNKTFKNYTSTVPSYAYVVSRAMFGDGVTPSSFRGVTSLGTADNATLRNYVTESLGYKIGSVPSASRLTTQEGEEATKVSSKSDSYWFSAMSAEKQLRQMFLFAGNKYNTEMNYKVTHYLNTYTAPSLPVATATNNGDVLGVASSTSNLEYRCALIDESASTLKLYPEVQMLMQYPTRASGGSGLLSELSLFKASAVTDLYVMGEKVRSFKPISIRLFTVSEDGTNPPFLGDFKSDTVAVGEKAKSLGNGKPVVYAGGNVNLKVSNNAKTDIASYSLDIIDTVSGVSVRKDFGNDTSGYDGKAEHNSFVSDVVGKLGVDVTLETEYNGHKETYNNFKTSMEDATVDATSEDYFRMEFKDGAFTDASKQSVIDDIKATYKVTDAQAVDIFNKADFEGQLNRALFTSKNVLNKSNNKWYDEETTTVVIKKFVTGIKIGDVMLNDKIDITSGPSQDADSKTLFTKGSTAKWYISLSLKEGVKLGNGSLLDLASFKNLWDKQYVKNADFVISDATTSDMRN